MELDPFLHKVQSVLHNQQRAFGNLTAIKADNEDAVTKILLSLDKIIDGAEDLRDKSKEKLLILSFLNTDTDLYADLKKSRKCAHLVGFFPKLSQDLFMKLIISLQLNQYLYEAITGFCPSLSYSLANLCLNSLNWCDLFEGISFLENVITSLFHKIVLTGDKDKFNIPLKDTFQRLLLQYDAEKSGSIKRMTRWKKTKLKHYAGLMMASLLSLLERCTNIYSENSNDISVSDIYSSITINEDSIKNSDIVSENRLFSIQQCYEHVVAKCFENVCSVTVDLWLFWVEIDLDDVPDTENTLQRLIGEKAYTCREALKEAERSGISSKEASELVLKLKSLALKPHTEDDEANFMSLDHILSNIQDENKDSKKWLKFLINKPSFALEMPALKVIQSHISSVESTDLEKLWKLIISFIKSNNECTFHKDFLLTIVNTLDVDSQMKLSKYFVDNFGVGLSEILKTEDFQPDFVETFNRVINEDDKEKEIYRQFLKLALQSPKAVVNRCVAEGVTSEVRGHLMADILAHLQPFCDASCEEESTLLFEALNELLYNLPNLPESHHTNYPLFVRELAMRKNLNGEQFINICIMKQIHQNLKTNNWVQMTACLESLSELYYVNCVYYRCPTSLVMILQVVQATRWTPTTFSMAAVRVCELALQLVEMLVSKWIDLGYGEKYLKNLSTLVQERISPLNRYHLYRLLTEEASPTDPALQLVYRMHYGISEWSVLQISAEERSKMVYGLCYILPLLTSQEWQELFCVTTPKCSEFLCLFHIVTDALLLCIDSSKVRASGDVMSCLGFALLNVAHVIKCETNRWNKNDNEYRISVLSKMCQLIAAFPSPQQDGFGLTLVKVLQQLLPEGSRRHPLSAEEMNTVTASLATVQAADLRQTLAREFLDMIHR